MNMTLSTKFNSFNKVFNSLNVVLLRNWREDDGLRDSVIRRFRFNVDLCLNFYQAYFLSEGLKVDYPKDVFRQVFKSSFITEDEAVLCLEMVDDRNLSSHTYNEDLAVQIAEHIAGYEPVLGKLAAKAAELV
jgi:nucleotidyltransferase substrate binding protein (TIGR01987 family)